MGGYERDCAPWSLRDGGAGWTRSRPTSTAACSRRTGTASRRSSANARRRVPAHGGRPRHAPDQRARRRSRPTASSASARPSVRGLFVAAGFCAHGLAGAGGIGKVMAEWIVERRAGARPVADGRPPLRRALPLAALHARARARGLRDLLRHQVPEPRAPGRPAAAASRRRTPGTREHGAAFGEKSGWERVNWYEANAAAGDEALRPRGWAGVHWSPAIGAEHRGLPRGRRRCSTRPRSPSSRSRGPGAAEFLERLCDNRVAREVGAVTYTQMLNRRGGIECDFTVTRLGRGPLRDRHRHRVRPPRPRAGSARTCRPTARRRARRGRDVALGVLRAVGPAGARRAARLHAGRLTSTLPVHDAARARRSATCRCARCG